VLDSFTTEVHAAHVQAEHLRAAEVARLVRHAAAPTAGRLRHRLASRVGRLLLDWGAVLTIYGAGGSCRTNSAPGPGFLRAPSSSPARSS
jgi:hypothetical protein